MADAKRDSNQITTLLAVSNADGVTPVVLWADPTTHRLLVDLPGGAGTVTTVSVVSANGFAGTVATATTTPAITLTTTITGILQGNGTAISAATTTGSGSVVLGTTPTLATPVINGTPTGTGVATAATASALVLRDANANIYVNNYFSNLTSTVSAGGTTVLTIASSRNQSLTGTLSQTFQLPDATTLTASHVFSFNNNSSGSLIVTNAGASTLYTVPAGGYVECYVTDVSTANGVWDFHAQPPSTVTWGSGTVGLVFNTALTTTPAISAGASSAANPSFIPQRGSATTGFGGDSTNLYLSIGGASKFSVNSTGHITVEGVTSTGATGTNLLVFATSPTLTTPVLGAATATSINKVAITAPATSATLTIADGKTLTASNSITLAGTDATTMTFPTTSKTIAANDGSNLTIASQAIGDILYASSTTAYTRLAAVAVGSVLTAAGTGTAPAWSSAPQITTIELGHATDTTLARVSAGVVSIEGSNILTAGAAQTVTGQNKFNNIIDVNNPITASGNAATVPVTYRLSTVTNNSAATLTITMTTTNAVDGQMTVVRILDFSAVAQTITWVNTEDSTVTAPTTSNGSTTLPLTVGFMYNNATSKWRCIAKA